MDRLLALALLLPPLLLAWPGPGSPLRADFLPSATGAGFAALATLPAAFLLIRRSRRSAGGFALLALPVLAIAGWVASGTATDAFELRRATLLAATLAVLFLGGSRLEAGGRAVYARGLVVVALLLLASASMDRENGFTGALGNTGSVAQAALPGALAGASLMTRKAGPWRLLGAAAVVLDIVLAARVPVIASALALAGAILVLAVAGPMPGRVRALLLGVAAIAIVGLVLPRPTPTSSEGSGSPATGGFAVRASIWSRSLAMLADRPWTGVGPGQFEARFPPYRDPKEIELSTHGRAIDAETEVEHPHEDWIAPALELGALAGLAWIAFLAVVGWRSLAALRTGDPDLEPLALGALGLLAYALVHAPLTREPLAAAIAFVLFGAVLARPKPARPFVPIAAAVLLLVLAPRALAFVRHGRALSDLAHATTDRALEACPDSPLALEIRARTLEEAKADAGAVRAAWEHVLALRPESFPAHAELGIALARAGDFAGARRELEHALALDPGHPGVRKNLLLVERELDLAEGRFDASREWLEGTDPIPEACYARSRKERAGGDRLLADLFEARAHFLWARQHAGLGRFDDAVRSYRQCLRVTRDHVEGGAPRVRWELAAALSAAGRKDEAVQEIPPGSLDDVDMPDWAKRELSDRAKKSE